MKSNTDKWIAHGCGIREGNTWNTAPWFDKVELNEVYGVSKRDALKKLQAAVDEYNSCKPIGSQIYLAHVRYCSLLTGQATEKIF